MLISIDINNMKKFYFIPVFILTGIIFQFSSCDEKSYTVTIKNESSRLVSYAYNGEINFLGKDIGVNNIKEYKVGPYTPAPKDINVIREPDGDFDNETMTIRMEKHEDNIYTFKDGDEINLSVDNTLPIDVVLKADNYIYFNGSTEVKIQAYGHEEGKIYLAVYRQEEDKIYTTIPNFTLFPSNYTVDWDLNEEGDTIHVTIK
jgi:hypothetical protein